MVAFIAWRCALALMWLAFLARIASRCKPRLSASQSRFSEACYLGNIAFVVAPHEAILHGEANKTGCSAKEEM